MVSKSSKVLLVGALAAGFYSTTRTVVSPVEVVAEDGTITTVTESMPLWENILLSITASLGFHALGIAAAKALGAKKIPGVPEKAGAAAAKVETTLTADAAKAAAAAEKAGVTAATKAETTLTADAAKAAAAAEKAGVTAATKVETTLTADAAKAAAAAEKAAAVEVAKGVVAAEKAGSIVTTDAVKAVAATAAAADETAKAAIAAERTAVAAADEAAKAGVASVKLADEAAKASATAIKASRSAVAASKVSSMLAKAGAMGPLGIIDLLVSAIVITLQLTVKNFDAEAYEPIPPGFVGYSQLPEEARVIIAQVPILGSLLDLTGPLFQFGEQCPEGMYQESPGGLCFPKCPDGYKSDGAFLCYKQYPEFENNGEIHTITSVTKNILVDTGTVPSTCGANDENDGGICYPKCRPGFHGAGFLCWADIVGVGVGTPVLPEPCPAGWNTDSDLTCSKPIVTSLDPCPEGSWDVAGTCWSKKNLYIDHVEGGDCYQTGDPAKPLWEAGHQETHCNPLRTVTEIKQIDVITRNLAERNMRTTGGDLLGRLNNGGICPPDRERIDGLCYQRCPDGYEHVPGAPYNCRKIGEPESYNRGSGSLPGCGDKDNISGLCYGKVPSGYTRKSLGLLDQDCPLGSAGDFGVGCVRESKSRSGTLKLVAELRKLTPD
jgi:hypothetical protein